MAGAVPVLSRLLPLALLGALPIGCVQVDLPRATPDAGPDAPPAPEPSDPFAHDPNPIQLPLAVDPSRHLCDGRDGLQVAAVNWVGGFRPASGSILYAQHGHGYFLLDGHCNYWVTGPDGNAHSGRNGTIGPELRDRMERDLHYQSWPALAGAHCRAVADGGVTTVSDVSATLSCSGGPYADVPSEFLEAFQLLGAFGDDLRATGAEETGPLRMYVVRIDPITRPPDDDLINPPVPWPLASDPASLALDQAAVEQGEPPPSLLVDVPADIAALRSLDASYHAEHRDARDQIPVRGPDGVLYDVFIRDVLPFDDADGHLVIPWRPR